MKSGGKRTTEGIQKTDNKQKNRKCRLCGDE